MFFVFLLLFFFLGARKKEKMVLEIPQIFSPSTCVKYEHGVLNFAVCIVDCVMLQKSQWIDCVMLQKSQWIDCVMLQKSQWIDCVMLQKSQWMTPSTFMPRFMTCCMTWLCSARSPTSWRHCDAPTRAMSVLFTLFLWHPGPSLSFLPPCPTHPPKIAGCVMQPKPSIRSWPLLLRIMIIVGSWNALSWVSPQCLHFIY